MNWISLLEYVVFMAVLTATVRPLGSYLAKVFCYEPTQRRVNVLAVNLALDAH